MRIMCKDYMEVGSRVEELFGGRDNEGRWMVFGIILEGAPARQREAMIAYVTVEALRDILMPGFDRRDPRLGRKWKDVLSGRLSADRFIHDWRLAHAAGLRSGEL